MKVAAIVQARMNSSRFFGKIMKSVYGNMSVLEYMVNRLHNCNELDEIIIATTPNSKLIHEWYSSFGNLYKKCKIHIGSEDDVLGRVYKAATENKVDIIVDLTSDCPLVCLKHINKLVKIIKNKKIDYACNIMPHMWPDGFDVQVYSWETLLKLNKYIIDPILREHTGWNIIDSKDFIFTNLYKYNLDPQIKYIHPSIRLTLDYSDDFKVIKNIIHHFEIIEGYKYMQETYSAEQIIDYVLANPEILVNGHLESKEPGTG